MPARPAERQRLADLMEQRRLELGLRWREVAEAGNISYEVIRAIRNGSGEIRPLSRHGIETGLRWEAGSVAAVLGGGDPVPLPELDLSGGDDAANAPYVTEILTVAYAALRSLATTPLPPLSDPDVRASLHQIPGALIFDEREAEIWDDARLSPKQRLDLLAVLRRLADRAAEPERRAS